MSGTSAHEVTQKAQEGIDRAGEVFAEYARMKGVDGDLLRSSDFDLYSGLLTDSFHWARLLNIDFALAFGEAYKLYLQESVDVE